jgi:hypothetical protein
MMQKEICETLARELAYVESSGCLRYIRIDYGLLSEACRSWRVWKNAEQEILEALSEVKRSSEICKALHEAPEHVREELYGQIYFRIKRAIDRLEECLRIAREAISPLRRITLGFSASIIFLGASSLISIPQNLLALAMLIAIILFSAFNIALTYIEPRLSVTFTLILCLILSASNILIGDVIRLYVSAAILAILIIDLVILTTKI